MTIKFINSLNRPATAGDEIQGRKGQQAAAAKAVGTAVSSALATVVSVSNVSRSANGKEAIPTEYKDARKIADSLADKIRHNPEEAQNSFGNIGASNALSLYS